MSQPPPSKKDMLFQGYEYTSDGRLFQTPDPAPEAHQEKSNLPISPSSTNPDTQLQEDLTPEQRGMVEVHYKRSPSPQFSDDDDDEEWNAHSLFPEVREAERMEKRKMAVLEYEKEMEKRHGNALGGQQAIGADRRRWWGIAEKEKKEEEDEIAVGADSDLVRAEEMMDEEVTEPQVSSSQK